MALESFIALVLELYGLLLRAAHDVCARVGHRAGVAKHDGTDAAGAESGYLQ